MDYDTLIADHERIEDLCVGLMKVAIPLDPDVHSAVAIRDRLASELRQHLSREDSFLYPRAINGRSGDFSALAKSFVSEFDELVEDWGTYLEEWSVECIETDWTTFCTDTRALVARVKFRVDRENSVIYPAALQAGAITLK